jgi:cyclic pyranopterin phosphate synthase
MTALIDGLGRRMDYLRLSVIDRCNLRCHYCMGADPEFLPKDEVLSLEELARLSRLFIRLGVRKIRLTGGEPLVRRDILSLVRDLGAEMTGGRLAEVTLTTNGTRLAQHAADLAAAGMRRINVSVDSLDPGTFLRITRGGQLEQVLDGIAAAKEAGLKVKVNTVVMPETETAEIDRLLAWCGQHGHDLTLIETMPLGAYSHLDAPARPLDMVRRELRRRWTLVHTDYRSGGPARYVTIAETGQRLGFITPMSHEFCDSCSRLRLTCTGQMVLCLGHETGIDLRASLRDSASDEELAAIITQALGQKASRHAFLTTQDRPRSRPMYQLGG